MDKISKQLIKKWDLPFKPDPQMPNVYMIKLYKNFLTTTDWLIARHQEETFGGEGTTLNTEELTYLIENRKKIRDTIKTLKNYK